MARRFTPLIVLLLAGSPGFGQISYPGGGYPGGGYPGGGYPRQRYPQGGQGRTPPASPQTAASTLTGMLRKIAPDTKSIVIESDDRDITTISIAGSTKYANASGGAAKLGDFQPGDHVSISANKDDKGVYHAARMAMVKEGTSDEHSAASLATDDTSRPIGIAPASGSTESSSRASGNEANRPKLRRAANSDDTTTTSPSNDDRPKLRRAPSSSDDTVPGTPAKSTTIPTTSNDDRPRIRRAVSGADDDTPKAQIAPDDSPTTAAPAQAGSAPGSPADPDRPRLRRPGDTPAADPTPVVSAARPSPRRLPPSGDPFIDQAREAAFSFSETLPNYQVKQFTTRYHSTAARGGKTSWQVLDNVTADVIEEDGNESYRNILVDGKKPLRDPQKTGSWSRGEFSSLMQEVMSPLTNADFHGKKASTIVNREAFRYDFSVEQPNSHWHIESESQSYLPAYSGTIWIDKENHRVLRIEMSALNLPRDFPFDTVEWAIDYDYVSIGESKFLLPAHSEALSCGRGTTGCTRNVIEFRNYRKFSADTSITFEPEK